MGTTLYWITTFDSILTGSMIITIISIFVGAIVGLPIFFTEYTETYPNKTVLRNVKIFLIICGSIALISGFVLIFLPSTEQAYMLYNITK